MHNLADTISINHNWLSAPGLMSHVAFISRELLRARGERGERGGRGRGEPSDESEAELEADCQRKLQAHAGTDVPSLLRMLDHFAERAIAALTRAADEGAATATAAGEASVAVSATRTRARLRARQRLPRYELRQIRRALRAVLGDVDDAGGDAGGVVSDQQPSCPSRGDNQREIPGSRRPMVTGWWRGEAEQLLERVRQVEPV